jgi:hypothetical protein
MIWHVVCEKEIKRKKWNNTRLRNPKKKLVEEEKERRIRHRNFKM